MNRVKAANDALAALVESTFGPIAGAKFHRNPKGQKAWAADEFAVVVTDDKEPETLRALSGGVYDLRLEVDVLFARRGGEAARAPAEWDDLDRLKAALAADVTLGGAVEDARLAGVEEADLDTHTWAGGGLIARVRLLFAAPSPAG